MQLEKSDNIEYIGKSAFEGCLSLKKFKIPSKINNVPKRCFFDCVNLTAVSSDSSIKNVEESAFENCTRLKNISKLDLHQLTGIFENAFKNCLSLVFDMKIDSVNTIKENAFDKCRKVRISGNSLNLENGFKYENINPNPQCSLKPSLKIRFLETASLLIMILSIILTGIPAFRSWQFSGLVVVVFLILICIFMSAVCFSFTSHKKIKFYSTL